MPKIILDVDKQHLSTIMTLLKAINPKLIKNISSDNKIIQKETKKQPLVDDFTKIESKGKYLSANTYKEKIYKNKELK